MDEIRITNESEYNSSVARAINRRTNFLLRTDNSLHNTYILSAKRTLL